MKPWLLVTGFGPFPGVQVNPTQLLVECLAGEEHCGLQVISRVLDVSFRRSARQLHEQLQRGWPRCVVHFGVATGADRLRIETQAVNRKAADIPDTDGEQFEGTAIEPSYSLDTALSTAVPAQEIVDSLNREGLPARVSDDAGRYVCNSIYFHSLAAIQAANAEVASVFVHVPAPGADPYPDSPGATAWTEQRLLLAARHVTAWLAQYVQAEK